MGVDWGEGNGRWGGWQEDEGIGEAGYNVGGLGACLRPRLRGIGRVSSRGIGVEKRCVEGGCRNECRVDGVRTERIGEGVAVV